MNRTGLVLALALALAGCSTDRTLETLIPRNALAVVLVDQPGLLTQLFATQPGIPWAALDTGRPWAAAAVPGNPPGFLAALALSDKPTSWAAVQEWAQSQGGLQTVRVGGYALLVTPGTPGGVLDPDRRFDLARVRGGGDPIAVYVDIKNVATEAALPEGLRPALSLLPWAQKNLAGLRVGFAPKNGGLELRLATDWTPGAEASAPLRSWMAPADPAAWTGLLPADGAGLVLSAPASAWGWAGSALGDSELAAWWSALAPLVGPRAAVAVTFGDKGSWTVAVESSDPQGVRQALRAVVASGHLQRLFPLWALDPDTPLIYQDLKDANGLRAVVQLGTEQVRIGYGTDRVVLTSDREGRLISQWRNTRAAVAAWTSEAPTGASVLGSGSVDGLNAQWALRVLPDANVELRLWADAASVKVWEARLPQVLLGWLSGGAGSAALP